MVLWWRLVLIGLLAADTEAFAPAPIRWAGSKRFVLSSTHEARRNSVAAPPQKLTIRDAGDRMSSNEIPSFTAGPGDTITWDAMGWCVEASGARSGDVVFVNQCTGGPTQRWRLVPWGTGRQKQIQLKGTNQCLMVTGVGIEGGLNGAPIELHECGNTVTQSWMFEEPLSVPTSYPSHRSTSSSPMLHVMTSFLSMTVLGALALSAWFWHGRKSGLVSHNGVPLTNRQGGVLLTEPALVYRKNVPLTAQLDAHVRELVPAAMAVSPLSAEVGDPEKDGEKTSVRDTDQPKVFVPVPRSEQVASAKKELQRSLQLFADPATPEDVDVHSSMANAINLLMPFHTPAMTSGFLQMMVEGSWEVVYSTVKVNKDVPQDKTGGPLVRVSKKLQKIEFGDKPGEGTLVNTIVWTVPSEDGIQGIFDCHCSLAILEENGYLKVSTKNMVMNAKEKSPESPEDCFQALMATTPEHVDPSGQWVMVYGDPEHRIMAGTDDRLNNVVVVCQRTSDAQSNFAPAKASDKRRGTV